MATWSKEVFSRNLRYYIDRAGVSQKELANIIGVSAPTVNDWCSGKKFPRIDRVELLAAYFGILKSDLIEDKNKVSLETKKEPAISDGLSDTKRELMDYVSELSDTEAAVLLASLKSALGKL